MGGGHGLFAPAFGLGTLPSFSFIFVVLTRYHNIGVDNILQFTVVLAKSTSGPHVSMNSRPPLENLILDFIVGNRIKLFCTLHGRVWRLRL